MHVLFVGLLNNQRSMIAFELQGAGGDDFDGIGADDLMGPNLQSLSSQQSASQVRTVCV